MQAEKIPRIPHPPIHRGPLPVRTTHGPVLVLKILLLTVLLKLWLTYLICSPSIYFCVSCHGRRRVHACTIIIASILFPVDILIKFLPLYSFHRLFHHFSQDTLHLHREVHLGPPGVLSGTCPLKQAAPFRLALIN
jgi:hypothetical protein